MSTLNIILTRVLIFLILMNVVVVFWLIHMYHELQVGERQKAERMMKENKS